MTLIVQCPADAVPPMRQSTVKQADYVKPRARFNWNRQAWFEAKRRLPRRLTTCAICGGPAFGREIKAGALCADCRYARIQEQREAYRAFRLAIMDGFIRRLPDGKTSCSDCGAPATCWEHRDYRNPTAVEPACDSCNTKRGRGMTAYEASFR